jgi:DNA-binding NarL/FixJ family response regulator
MNKLTLWMIEDNAAFRNSAIRALRKYSVFRQLQAFDCCEEALKAMATEARPDVVLLDIGLPGMGGLKGIGELKAVAPDAAILILTVFEDDDKIFRALCSGASGYLLKGEPIGRVAEAIEQAVSGGAPLNARVAHRVLQMFSKLSSQHADYGLTERETTVLQLMAEGLSKKQIARRLDMNGHTTDYVIRCIYRKLHVNCMTSAVSVALRDHLVTPHLN